MRHPRFEDGVEDGDCVLCRHSQLETEVDAFLMGVIDKMLDRFGHQRGQVDRLEAGLFKVTGLGARQRRLHRTVDAVDRGLVEYDGRALWDIR